MPRTPRSVGFDVAPWTGAKLMSTLNQQAIGENGARTYAQYGLSQSLPLGKRWTVDGTLDASNTLQGQIPTGAVVNAFQPVASGRRSSGSVPERRRLCRGDARRGLSRGPLVVERPPRISQRRQRAIAGA